jgi:CRISPR type III-B/RAMP module-associated protein Cmr5
MALATLAQQRAKHAWAEVEKAFQRPDFEKRFADPAKKMPARIRASGLGQTVAFMRAKEGSDVLNAVESWCLRDTPKEARTDALMAQFKDGDATHLRHLTAEALGYLEWLVRFADGKRKGK